MNSKKYNNKLQIERAFRRGQELMKLNNYIQENLYFNKCQKNSRYVSKDEIYESDCKSK